MIANHPRLRRAALAALLVVSALAALAPAPLRAQDATEPFSTKWALFRVGEAARSGPTPLVAVLWLTLEESFHAYANPPGATGMPTSLRLREGEAGPPLAVLYPPGTQEPDVFEPKLTVNTYHGTVPLFVPLELDPGERLDLRGTLALAACSDKNCWPLRAEVALTHDGPLAELPDAQFTFWFPLYSSLTAADQTLDPLAAAAPGLETRPGAAAVLARLEPRYLAPGLEVTGLGLALVLAFLAGLVLNFMPCVLPVVSLKLSGLLAGGAEADPDARIRAFREHNLYFSAGVLLYFLALGGALAALGLAWGQLFQSPAVVLGLTVAVFALALSLFGLYSLPVVDLKAGRSGSPRAQALFTGVLATLLATPCSGPFLGGVLGWVLLQRPEVVLAVFLSLGLGMASPFLLMAARPGLARLLPRPGAWMRHLERGVGFFLLGTCVYLLSILPGDTLVPALALLWAVGLAAWMWGGWTGLSDPPLRRALVRAAALAVVAAAWFLLLAPAGPRADWEPYDEAAFRAALGNEPVLLDFTADWCPNCKLLEHTALAPENLARWQRRWGLRLMQVDMTRETPGHLELLRALGSQSIPVVAVFPAGADSLRPLVLRDLFTSGQMDAALQEALAPGAGQP
ncbi:cytochrome c biogenesis protein CcdA [Desulfocurvus sp.]|uniref:protein-disulfide reductase DsbD family protein n=1 Tax=Desulfocurvus sp. TaxID=2871698 RepID=UPI0025B83492|nr:cytochrome c biogenesis protein CcdA [Desulfocurvus sp.]MCK9240237.1 thioredoxin family protein [Desulfocurvus sp.]